MKTSSAKGKGRRGCQQLRDKLLETFPQLQPDDIKVTPSGVTGEDLWLSPFARLLVPFTFEVKNVEKLNIWSAISQARAHSIKNKATPAVAFTRNREKEMWVAIPLSTFVSLVREEAAELVKAVKVINDLPST